uniref:Uncharacterized protein n=1 Tax=Romanomermis culicivorax TaxID=13658 RepID=A0A915L855_ROMCU
MADGGIYEISRLARLTSEDGKQSSKDGVIGGASGAPFGNAERKITGAALSGVPFKEKGPSSLFIFSSDNFVRRYASNLIEWPYPFLPSNSSLRIAID